jgi:hypothetical protein
MKLLFGLMFVALVLGACVGYPLGTGFERDITVTDFEATTDSSGNVYLFSDELGNVYQADDCLMRGHFSSGNVYFKVQQSKGNRVHIKGYGWRFPLFSLYPNVIGITDVRN